MDFLARFPTGKRERVFGRSEVAGITRYELIEKRLLVIFEIVRRLFVFAFPIYS